MACASSAEVNWALAGAGFGLTIDQVSLLSAFNRKVQTNVSLRRLSWLCLFCA